MLYIKKIAAAVIIPFLALSSVFSCSSKDAPPKGAKELRVDFLDVGKADAMVIQTETGTVVIDCGEKGDGKKIANVLEESGRTSVDYLIITHFDKDHVGGAPKVLKSLEVKNVLTPDYDGTVEEYDKFCKVLEETGVPRTRMTEDMTFTLDDAEFTVYAPKETFYGENDENDFSLVTKVVHHKNTLLFTGDAMEQRLDEIMDIGQCTLLKVPYHGRKLDNFKDFLKVTSPKSAVVCTSSNEFSGKVQDALSSMKIPVYATCFNGNITAVSNGGTIEFTTEKDSVS